MVNPAWLKHKPVPVEVKVVFPKERQIPTLFIGTAQCYIELSPSLDPLNAVLRQTTGTLMMKESVLPSSVSILETAMDRREITARLAGLELGNVFFRCTFPNLFQQVEYIYEGVPLRMGRAEGNIYPFMELTFTQKQIAKSQIRSQWEIQAKGLWTSSEVSKENAMMQSCNESWREYQKELAKQIVSGKGILK